MITVSGLTKQYGKRLAVDDLTFEVAAGRVTGFVGPNGAGKSTTMRMMVGLTRPDRGEVRYDGIRYTDLEHPARVVGSVLDARCMHPGRTARNHLRAMAALSGIPAGRVDEVLAEVGLETRGRPAGRRVLARHAPTARPGRRAARRPARSCCSTSRPTASTPTASAGCAPTSSDFADRGGTVFVSSHLIGELAHVRRRPRRGRRRAADRRRVRPRDHRPRRRHGRPSGRRSPTCSPPSSPRTTSPPRSAATACSVHGTTHRRRVADRLRPRHPPGRAHRDDTLARGEPARHDPGVGRVRLRLTFTTRPKDTLMTTLIATRSPSDDVNALPAVLEERVDQALHAPVQPRHPRPDRHRRRLRLLGGRDARRPTRSSSSRRCSSTRPS